jgi:tetratricopeptide (TPR) repeat protein
VNALPLLFYQTHQQKPITMFRITFFFALILALAACSQKPQDKSAMSVNEIPLLLDRHEAIQQGNEWNDVQNYYGLARNELLNDPKDHEAALKLVQVYINEARITGEHGHYYPAALKMSDFILQNKDLQPDLKFRTLAAKAGVQLSLHDFKNALQTGLEAQKLNPYNAQNYGVLVDANVELGNYEEAVKMADKMVSIRPDLRSYARVSYLREIHGDVEGAIEAMNMAVEAGYPGQEQTAWARLTLGNMYKEYGKLDEAEGEYRKILADRSQFPFAIAALGDLEMERKNYKEAEKLLKEAANIIPEVGFYESLARLYKMQGDEKRSKAILDQMWPMLEDDEKNGHNMSLEYATIYGELVGDWQKALKYAQKEYNLRPNNIDVNRKLAQIYQKLGKVDKMAEHLQKAKSTNSKNPELMQLAMSK